jgi:hypothetical protein
MGATEIREERGPKTPAESVVGALELLRLVRDAIGFSPASSEIIVHALGHETLNGTSKRKLAVLNHYDLLERVGKSAYRVSPLGKALLAPRDDNEYKTTLVEVARRPKLFQELFRRYGSQPLPGALKNILIREFGVQSSSSEQLVSVFKETAEAAGLLRNGILYDALPDEPRILEPSAAESAGASAVAGVGSNATDGPQRAATTSQPARLDASTAVFSQETRAYSIPLDLDGRIATVVLPVPVLTRDLTQIMGWLKLMYAVAGNDEPATS